MHTRQSYPQYRPSDVKKQINYQSLLGPTLGKGSFRYVHQHAQDPSLVVKVAKEKHHAARNQSEYNAYLIAKQLNLQHLLCPVIHISPCGKYLIQQRATRIADQNPKKARKPNPNAPHWLKDNKWENFGSLNGNTVILDYEDKRILQILKSMLKTQKPQNE